MNIFDKSVSPSLRIHLIAMLSSCQQGAELISSRTTGKLSTEAHCAASECEMMEDFIHHADSDKDSLQLESFTEAIKIAVDVIQKGSLFLQQHPNIKEVALALKDFQTGNGSCAAKKRMSELGYTPLEAVNFTE